MVEMQQMEDVYELYGIAKLEDFVQHMTKQDSISWKEVWNGILLGNYEKVGDCFGII